MPCARYWMTLNANYFMKPSKSPLKTRLDEPSLQVKKAGLQKVTCPRSQANYDVTTGHLTNDPTEPGVVGVCAYARAQARVHSQYYSCISERKGRAL